MKDGKSGPISRAEFEALFATVNDPSYARAFVEQGEGNGYEAHTQAMEQFERLSLSVDRTFGAFYLLPFSGQTSPPATGGAKATVTLTFSRSAVPRFGFELTLPAGLVVAEEMNDMSPEGSVVVETGRRFVLPASAGFAPGDVGPLDVAAQAEAIGATYDDVQPGRLTSIVQAGAGFSRGFASVVPGVGTHALVLDPNPDVISAAMVGSYVELVAGSNLGAVRRIVGYLDPNAAGTPPDGGTALLAATGVYRLSSVAGQFLAGEVVEQFGSAGTARVVFHSGKLLVADRLTLPNLVPNVLLVGATSGAVAIASMVEQQPDLVAETQTATWKVLGWETDFGLSVTNAESPEGGTAATLDELAEELSVGRAVGEGDDALRERAASPEDLITPNAVLRAANRVLVNFGVSASLREVGLANLPGTYLDGDPLDADPSGTFAFDLGFVTVNYLGDPQFLPGEVVEQVGTDGAVATAKAVMSLASLVGPPPQPLPASHFAGLVDVRGTFVAGRPIVGTKSGASVTPTTVTPSTEFPSQDWIVLLDYLEFRAFFLVGIPPSDLGEFGVAFDAGNCDAFDASPWLAFFDGFPLTAASIARSVWQEVDRTKAAGVGFDLVLDA